ncbi:nucleotidyltransferase domain protein [Peptococcaceae bacterium CEB3]|nr:nucleotidyltransferase domain protein [Peptococcaceae bacterium CEB3]
MAFDLGYGLIERICEVGQTYDIERIVLFGSRARGDNKPTSDIDLAVYPSPGFALQGHLSRDLGDLRTLLKIDTVFITGSIDPRLVHIIEKEGVTLYERSQKDMQ